MQYEADLHIHSLASNHAFSTVTEIAAAAAQKGLKMIAITDHGPSMPDGPHEYYFKNLFALPEVIAGVRILKGVEANILGLDGSLDLPPHLLEKLDVVLAGFHEGTGYLGTTVEDNTQAMINALNNPFVHIIVHPGNPVFPINHEKVVLTAKRLGKVIEFNNKSFSLSRAGSSLNCQKLAALAKKHKLKVVLNSDAHYCTAVGVIPYAAELVHNIGISSDQILNTSAEKVDAYLQQQKKRLQGITAAN